MLMHCKQHKCLHACRANDEITCALSRRFNDLLHIVKMAKPCAPPRIQTHERVEQNKHKSALSLSARLNMNVYLYIQT
jgi:hypothetical protein